MMAEFGETPIATTLTIGADQFRVYEWHVENTLNENENKNQNQNKPKQPLFVLHHGAGSSALTFSLSAIRLAQLLAKDGARVVAFDARGHGATICENEALDPLLLVADLVAIVAAVRRDVDQEIVLIGHSMGASIVVSAANSIPNVVAAGVIDVVEGTAIESLSHMHSVLRNRPAKFRSTDDAIKWSLRSHLLQNKESAKISVPHLLKRLAGEPPVFTWRTDLAASEPYWKSWFEGLSSRFLAMKCARLLVLAGADRLDKELTIGQMQGKFQVVVYPESWHYVQEDVPDKLAETLTEFWTRNQKLVTIKRFPIPIKPAAATVGATAPQE